MKNARVLTMSLLGVGALVALGAILMGGPRAQPGPGTGTSQSQAQAEQEQGSGAADIQAERETSSAQGLYLAVQTDTEIRGRYNIAESSKEIRDALLMKFQELGLEANTIGSQEVQFEVRMESPALASVQVRVGEMVLDVSAEFGEDGQVSLATIDGHGKTLATKDKLAVMALSEELEGYFDAHRRTLAPHEFILQRVVALLGAAPAGFEFNSMEIGPSD